MALYDPLTDQMMENTTMHDTATLVTMDPAWYDAGRHEIRIPGTHVEWDAATGLPAVALLLRSRATGRLVRFLRGSAYHTTTHPNSRPSYHYGCDPRDRDLLLDPHCCVTVFDIGVYSESITRLPEPWSNEHPPMNEYVEIRRMGDTENRLMFVATPVRNAHGDLIAWRDTDGDEFGHFYDYEWRRL